MYERVFGGLFCMSTFTLALFYVRDSGCCYIQYSCNKAIVEFPRVQLVVNIYVTNKILNFLNFSSHVIGLRTGFSIL